MVSGEYMRRDAKMDTFFICLLASRRWCSCGGEEYLTEKPECVVWGTSDSGQGEDKEGLLLHLTQGERELQVSI